jgi:CBS domain-containing protein
MERTDAGLICTRTVTIARRETPLVEAAQLMRSEHAGCVVVVDEVREGRLVCGILTDRDVVTALEADSVTDLVRAMRRRGVRRLPVTTPQRVLVGLVTLDDVLSLVAEQLRAMSLAVEAEQLQERRARR